MGFGCQPILYRPLGARAPDVRSRVVACVQNTERLPHKPATCTTDGQLVHRLGITRSASSYGTLSLEKEGATCIINPIMPTFSTDFPVFWPAPFVMQLMSQKKKQGSRIGPFAGNVIQWVWVVVLDFFFFFRIIYIFIIVIISCCVCFTV